MSASGRSRVFFFRHVPTAGGNWPEQPIAINAFEPIEFENEHFQGRMMLIHDTGNEPGVLDDEVLPGSEIEGEAEAADQPLRGIEMQIQGRFKTPCSLAAKSGIWVSAEIESPLKLGWIMKNIAMLFVKFAQQKSGGRLQYSFGNATESPKIGFPLSTVFKCNIAAPGKSAPRLGSNELSEALKYLGPNDTPDISPDSTCTFACATKFLDLCSWEVLNVPAASPLPLERLIGDVRELHLSFYDLGKAGSHAAGRQNALLHFTCRRAEEHERAWDEHVKTGARTPLDDASDLSEASDADEFNDQVEEDHPSDDSDSDGDPMEDEEEISKQESLILDELDAWKPSPDVANQIGSGIPVRVPFYMEAIDRRQRWKLHAWYFFTVPEQSAHRDWWHAMAVPQLASFCSRRPRTIRTFRRGTQAAAVKRYGAQSLEQFRHVVCSQLEDSESKLRQALVKVASTGFTLPELSSAEGDDNKRSPASPDAGTAQKRVPTHKALLQGMSKSMTGALDLAEQMKTTLDLPGPMRKKRTRVWIPPRFLVNSGSKAIQLAFAHAKDGRSDLTREGLVGAIHFEGRISEELMRISMDGCVRLFTPYHCDKPRMRLLKHQLLSVKPVEGLFLGRFHVFEVHTELRVFSFCCQDREDCDAWVDALETARKAAWRMGETRFPSHDNDGDPTMQLLRDTTHAQRWRQKKRLVLNDRRVFAPYCVRPADPSVGAALLQQALTMPVQPTSEDLVGFLDATCILKTMQFRGWVREEYISFWLNVYHCLLLHGRFVFGTPKTRSQQSRFYSRVSYLVAMVPVSLREIETFILGVPKFDVIAANAVYSRALAGQDKFTRSVTSFSQLASNSFSFSNLFSWPFGSTSEQGQEEEDKESDCEQEVGEESVFSKFWKSLPLVNKVPLPKLKLPWKQKLNPCLFVGYPADVPGREHLREKDHRIALVLNRGNLACLKGIPLFTSADLHAQLDDVSRCVVREFVKVEKSRLGSRALVVPQRFRGLWRELHRDTAALARFVWEFMPPENGQMPSRVSFRRIVATPQAYHQMTKHTYTNRSLQVEPPRAPQLDSELQLVNSGKLEAWRPWVVKL